MTEQEKPILESIEIRYKNAPSIYLTAQQIELMTKAAEALDMIHLAKNVAVRLSKL